MSLLSTVAKKDMSATENTVAKWSMSDVKILIISFTFSKEDESISFK